MATTKLIWRGGYHGRPGWYLQTDYPASLRGRLRAVPDLTEIRTGVFWVPAEAEATLCAHLPAVAAHRDAPRLL